MLVTSTNIKINTEFKSALILELKQAPIYKDLVAM